MSQKKERTLMKKRLLLSIAALSTSAMLFGFDSAETAESVIDKANAVLTGNLGGLYEIIPGFIAGLLAAWIVSLLDKKPSEEITALFEKSRQRQE